MYRNKPKIFQGIRVLDFSRVLAGPYCTRLLADMGAEVIKVEQPITGDDARSFPYIIDEKDTGYYIQQNCGKKSISLDIKQKEAIEILKKLAANCDVVVENFRPGVMAKYGLDYDSLKECKKDLIMCSISAYGQTGPYSSYVGNDLTIQAMSGFMDMTGQPDGPPQNAGTSIADTIAGAHAFGAIASALYHRENTGEGEYIDIAMLDCMFTQFEIAIQMYVLSNGEIEPRRFGSHHPNVAPLGTYKAKDGWVIVGVFNDKTWNRLTEVMGRPELGEDPRFQGNTARAENKDAVIQLIEDWLKDMTVEEALEKLREARVLTSPVLSIPEVVNNPQIRDRDMLIDINHHKLGMIKIVNTPIKFNNAYACVSGKAAFLGEHNDEILGRLGFNQEKINKFKEKGILYE